MDNMENYPGCFCNHYSFSLPLYDKLGAKTPIQLLLKALNSRFGGSNKQHISAKRADDDSYVLTIPQTMYKSDKIDYILARLFWAVRSKKVSGENVVMQVDMNLQIDNKVPLIYISGWKGAGKESGTYKWLARHFKNIYCYAAGGQTDVEKMISDMEKITLKSVSDSDVHPILIGNSYGGFIASLVGGTQVLLNPALFPSETLPKIAELSAEEIENFKRYEKDWPKASNRIFAICTDGDELIPNHRTEVISTNAPIMIPGGAHRLTDEQRDRYLLPLLAQLIRPTYRIVKFACDSLERLAKGECCGHAARRFPTTFASQQNAEDYLQWYIERPRDVDAKPVIGYAIQEIYGDNPYDIYRQWSYTPAGQFLVDAHINSTVQFYGREPKTLPFHKGDYVIAYYCGDLYLGLIRAAPLTHAEYEKLKQRALSRWPHYFWLDSSDDSYVTDFTHEYHGHPSVTQVFPLPFDASEISDEVKTALHWAENLKADK